MSEIGLTITPNVATTQIIVDTNTIQFTPNDIQLSVYTQGAPVAGGSQGQLQYNNLNTLAGAANTNVANGNVTFQNLPNLKIAGGSNAYFLQTDGTGNLTWAPGTINANTGPGVANGANTQIQMTDGTGNFISAAGFTFNYISNTLSVPGDGLFTGNINSGNANLGNLAIANYFQGNGYYLTGITSISNGNSNVNIPAANGNVNISVAGNANIAVFTGVGVNVNGNLYVTGSTLLENLRTRDSEIAIGNNAQGLGNTGTYAIAIGVSAGESNQGQQAIAIGESAGDLNQGNQAVAIGTYAGLTNQGANSIAIGAGAGNFNQDTNSIILNATGANITTDGANRFFVKPIRNIIAGNALYYNPTTGEITYNTAASFSSIISNGTSNVDIATANGNVTFGINGTSNVVVVSNTAVNVNANANITGTANIGGDVNITGTTSLANITINGLGTVKSLQENFVANANTGIATTLNIDLLNQSIFYVSNSQAGAYNLNFRGNSTTTLNNTVTTNNSITTTFLMKNIGTASYIANVQVDGTNQTVLYLNGITPNISSPQINVTYAYTYNILKTAANTYTILGSFTGYA